MFSKATANFVHQIDPDGSLIHVSRLNDSCKLVPMALVVKRNRVWMWQRPKYQTTQFTLSNLLLGDRELAPGVRETEFLSYKGTFGGKIFGKLETTAASFSVDVEGRGSSELQSCFGDLKKQEVDVNKLLRDSRNRLVDMQHVLVQQLKKRAEVLALVKECIVTTTSGLISQTKQEQCTFQGVLGLLRLLGSRIQDTNNLEMDSDVSLEIPSDTVIAYSILELDIKKNGQFDLCLQPDTIGGFESELSPASDSSYEFCSTAVDGKCGGEEERLSLRLNGSQEMALSPLAELPQLTQSSLFQKLRETLKDRSALSYLQYEMERCCVCGETLEQEERESVSATVDQPDSECGRSARAALLLVSALEELPDETLSLLSESRADFLVAFDKMMCSLKTSSGPLPIQCLPALLQDNQTFQLVEQLLGSTNVTLRRNAEGLWMEKTDGAGVLPLLLCLSVHGLSVLSNGTQE